MQGTEAFEHPADVPGHVRPFPTKQLKCQSLQRSTRHPQQCPPRPSHFLMRHRSAADMRPERPNCNFGTGYSPILRQFPNRPRLSIKAAAAPLNIRQQVRRPPATFGLAQALAICPLPHTKQNRKCLRNAHSLTFIGQFAFRRGKNDIDFTVTTRERVGRTIMVRSISRRD